MGLQEDREALKRLLMAYSIQRGREFVLASGRRSNVYVDARLTTLRAEAIPLVGRLFLAKIQERGWEPDAVGGLTLGADPIAVAVARESLNTGRLIHAFIVRKEVKKHGMQREIEGIETGQPLKVVVVEDVATTGASAAQAVAACRRAGWTVLGVISLVDRGEGAREHIERDLGCPFESIFELHEFEQTN